MARVVVVGGGFAGLSVAARLAKLRHDVTLLESSDQLGGRLRGVQVGGARWPLDPETMTLPGVVRDLFKKSGRPLERVLELKPAPGPRHVFSDRTVLDLPMGTRGAQHDAVAEALGHDTWSPWVDQWADVWDAYRRSLLDQVPTRERDLPRDVRKILDGRRSVKKSAKPLKDERLEAIVLDRITIGDSDPRVTPALAGAWHYVERNFGRWQFEGGHTALADALEARLAERNVEVRLGVRVDYLRPGPVLETSEGEISPDIVIWCTSRVPALVKGGLPAVPASRTFLTLDDSAPQMPDETLVHDRWAIRVFTAGANRWVIEHRAGEDPLVALARSRIDLRKHVVERHDLSASDVAALGHFGWTWLGFTSMFSRPGAHPSKGIYVAGAIGPFGASLEEIGMGTAAIAAHIGEAPR